MRLVLKIAYDGTEFHGVARQPGLRTVEGEVIKALSSARAIRDVRSSRFQSASRTDRGVSALGNVVAFTSLLAPAACVRSLNAKARGVWAWASARVPDDFSARRARDRWYRYFLPRGRNVARLNTALRVYEGEHDFRNFTRDRTRTLATIGEASARIEGPFVALDFHAPSFRWNLVRRLVAAALRVETGLISLELLQKALDARIRIDLGLAPPEPLVLMDVAYGFDVPAVPDRTTESRILRLVESRTREMWFLQALRERLDGRSLQGPPISKRARR